jgi:rRNA maturation endonuclease Nob1
MKYSDGNDYSHLKPNLKKEYPHLKGCVNCDEGVELTILPDKDICHSCGYVYT